MITDHDFLPVAGHPDDDECTHRSDGTDATYCGEPRSRHEAGPIPQGWAQIACGTCGAQPQQRCRTASGGVAEPHAARRREGNRLVAWRREYAARGCRCSTPQTGMWPNHGLSAYAILHGGTDHPHDPSDLCRCLRVSPQPPLHMANRSRQWAGLVKHWSELAALLVEEHPNGTAPKTYQRMKEVMAGA